MTPRLLFPAALRAALSLAVALAFAAAPQAQIVFADFETLDGDGNPANAFAFGDSGFGPGDGYDGNTALSVGTGPAGGNGFAGAGTSGDGGAGSLVDISGAEYITFYFNPGTIPASETGYVLQVNLQEDVNGNGQFDAAAGGEDEFQAEYRITPSATPDFELIAIPLAAFTDDNVAVAGPGADDGFDFTKLLNVVFAFAGYDAADAEFTVRFDDIVFRDDLDNLSFTTTNEFADFETLDGDGNPANAFAFGDSGFGPGDGYDGNTALSVGTGPAGGNGFAGAGTSGDGGAGSLVDISGAEYITFYFNPGTIPASETGYVLQVNLQEDVNGNGQFDAAAGGEDEFQAEYRITPSATPDFELIAIPLAAFTDDNVAVAGPGADDGFDFTKLLNVVFAFAGYDAADAEFTVRFDDINFATASVTGGTDAARAPEVFSVAPAAFPNPTTGAATVTFDLASPSAVRADVIDLLGRRVATLADGTEAAGEVRLAIPAGTLVPGTYVVRVQTDAGAAMTRITVTR